MSDIDLRPDHEILRDREERLLTMGNRSPVPWRLEWDQEYGDFGSKIGSPYVTGIKAANNDWVVRFDDDYGNDQAANAAPG